MQCPRSSEVDITQTGKVERGFDRDRRGGASPVPARRVSWRARRRDGVWNHRGIRMGARGWRKGAAAAAWHRNAPIYGHHDGVWKLLGEQLAWRRRGDESRPGLPGGKICLILAERDPIVIKDEWIADSIAVLGEDAVDISIIKGGHEIAISKGREVADVAMASWR